MNNFICLALGVTSIAFGKTTPVYVGTRNDGIYTLQLNETSGKMTGKTLAVRGAGMVFQDLHPNGELLFSALEVEGKGGVGTFKITESGLAPVSKQKYRGKGLCHVSTDATGRVLFGADYGAGSVVSFSVNEFGGISSPVSYFKHEGSSEHPKRQKAPHAHSFYAGPSNQFAYAPDLGIDQVKFYRFDPSSAKLEDQGGFAVPKGSGPRHMKFGKDGRFAYVLNELTLTVSVFRRNTENGELSLLETVSVLPEGDTGNKMTCSEIRVSKDGRFIYTANRDLAQVSRDSISLLEVGVDGRLTLLQTAFAKVSIPRNINLSPSGIWLLVAGQKSDEVTSHRVNTTTGQITFSGHRAKVPTAMCITFGK